MARPDHRIHVHDTSEKRHHIQEGRDDRHEAEKGFLHDRYVGEKAERGDAQHDAGRVREVQEPAEVAKVNQRVLIGFSIGFSYIS